MKVKCRLCEHESNGFCTKKTNNSKPIKIELNKSRTCDKYEEAGLRVLGEYRAKEAHKKKVLQLKQRNLQIYEQITKAQEELASRKKGLILNPSAVPVSSPTLTEESDDSL